MRRIFIPLLFFILVTSAVFATSEQAYQDYLFQFDLYRKANTEFKVAKNEYEKFKTLTSQATALDKTRAMLTQRNQLLRAYLLLLDEKLNEDTGLDQSERTLYRTLLRNEISFLESHSNLIAAIGSLTDADTVSKQQESRNITFQTSIRQTLIAIGLGKLTSNQHEYDTTLASIRSFVTEHRSEFSTGKQATIDRWLLQITNKENLFQQKVNSISQQNSQLKTRTLDELNKKFQPLQTTLNDAHQDLVEGASFMNEVVRILALGE